MRPSRVQTLTMTDDYSLYKTTPLPFIYAGEGGVAGVLNTLQILLIINKENNKTAFDHTLVSLAISDLLYATCSIVTSLTLKYLHSQHSWFIPYLHIVFSAGTFSITSSVFHVIYIAIERTIAVYYPLKHHFCKKVNRNYCHCHWLVFISHHNNYMHIVHKYIQEQCCCVCK